MCVKCVQSQPHILHLNPHPLLCRRRNCIISAYYQQRETHKPTLPNVSMKQVVLMPCFVLAIYLMYFSVIPLCPGPRRLVRRSFYLFWSRVYINVHVKNRKKKTYNCFPYVWNVTKKVTTNRQGCMFTLCQQKSIFWWQIWSKVDLIKPNDMFYIFTWEIFCKANSETLTQQQTSASDATLSTLASKKRENSQLWDCTLSFNKIRYIRIHMYE